MRLVLRVNKFFKRFYITATSLTSLNYSKIVFLKFLLPNKGLMLSSNTSFCAEPLVQEERMEQNSVLVELIIHGTRKSEMRSRYFSRALAVFCSPQ